MESFLMLSRIRTTLLAFTIPVISLAQAPTSPTVPDFAVVAIKPNLDGHGGNIGFTPDGYNAQNYALSDIIKNAYDLRSPKQLADLPGWAKTARYDIEAKFDEADVSKFQEALKQHRGYRRAQAIFQHVLVDRFVLRCHWEQRTLPIYSLRLMHTNSHLHASNPADADKPMQVGEMTYYPGGITRTFSGQVVAHGIPLSFFAEWLMEDVQTIVNDDTHLAGLYDIDMQLAPGPQLDVPGSFPENDSLVDQLYLLSLKLVPIKASEPVLVIDSIQPPTPN